MAAAPQEQQTQYPQPQEEQQYGSNEEYITALQGWIAQLYQLQCVAISFPYFLASLHSQVRTTLVSFLLFLFLLLIFVFMLMVMVLFLLLFYCFPLLLLSLRENKDCKRNDDITFITILAITIT